VLGGLTYRFRVISSAPMPDETAQSERKSLLAQARSQSRPAAQLIHASWPRPREPSGSKRRSNAEVADAVPQFCCGGSGNPTQVGRTTRYIWLETEVAGTVRSCSRSALLCETISLPRP